VVDDDPVNRDVLRVLLAPLGFELAEAGDGEAALASAAALPPDLILLDLRLGRLDGSAVTRRLRALPGGAALGIVAVSASVFPSDQAGALAAGCDAFEPKPLAVDSLLATIGRLLDLEWEIAPAPAGWPRTALPNSLPEGWPLPDAVRLRVLEEYADLGDLAALRAALAEARGATHAAQPFLDALEHFATQAELAALRAWLAAALRRSPPAP
jgi:CheY-like chemotaxis protein